MSGESDGSNNETKNRLKQTGGIPANINNMNNNNNNNNNNNDNNKSKFSTINPDSTDTSSRAFNRRKTGKSTELQIRETMNDEITMNSIDYENEKNNKELSRESNMNNSEFDKKIESERDKKPGIR